MVNSISSTNTLIKQIFDLNTQIKTATAGGDTASAPAGPARRGAEQPVPDHGHQDQPANADGSVNVSTTDGVNLVSNTYAQLAYSGGAAERHLWQYHQSRTSIRQPAS